MAATARIHYQLSLSQPHAHVVDISLRVEGCGDYLDLCMAAWSPGSYLIRDYARYVRDLRVDDELAVAKVDKHTWRVHCGEADTVTVHYQVYGHDLTVRTNHIDDSHAFVHGPATFLFPAERLQEPCSLAVQAPEGWELACGLWGEPSALAAATIDELLDCPLHLAPNPWLTDRAFEAAGKPARLVIWGEPDAGGVATVDDLVTDLTAIMNTHGARFGGVPYEQYTFLLMLSPGAYGGLEHGNSSANLHSPYAFSTRKDYEGLLELLSHEFFHAWNGKRIRPRGLGPFDYTSESYTPSLWVQEGITSYIDRWTVRRAGRISVPAYLEKLASEWGSLQAIPGRSRQSLQHSSFDAWIKLYKPDESNVNSTVSYYLKGGLVSLALDLEIRQQTGGERTLEHVLALLWERYGASSEGYEETALLALFEQATGAQLAPLFDRCIHGTADPDLSGALATVGLELVESREPEPGEGQPEPVWLGITVGPGLIVRTVLDGGPAAAAGVSPGDELLAVDQYRVRTDQALRARLCARGPGQGASVTLFRRDRLVTAEVCLQSAPPNRFTIKCVPEASDLQRKRFTEWLGEQYPADDLAVAATVSTWM